MKISIKEFLLWEEDFFAHLKVMQKFSNKKSQNFFWVSQEIKSSLNL